MYLNKIIYSLQVCGQNKRPNLLQQVGAEKSKSESDKDSLSDFKTPPNDEPDPSVVCKKMDLTVNTKKESNVKKKCTNNSNKMTDSHSHRLKQKKQPSATRMKKFVSFFKFSMQLLSIDYIYNFHMLGNDERLEVAMALSKSTYESEQKEQLDQIKDLTEGCQQVQILTNESNNESVVPKKVKSKKSNYQIFI